MQTGVKWAMSIVLAATALGCASSEGNRGVATDRREVTSIRINEAERIEQARKLAERAERAEREDDPQQAISYYRRAVAAWGDFPAAWNNLGVLLLEEGRYLDAAEAFVSASERASADPRPIYNLGLTWERTRHLREAEEQYARALERDPRYLPALRGAIHAKDRLGVTDETTLERLRAALMLETDPQWRAYFERRKLEAEAELSRPD